MVERIGNQRARGYDLSLATVRGMHGRRVFVGIKPLSAILSILIVSRQPRPGPEQGRGGFGVNPIAVTTLIRAKANTPLTYSTTDPAVVRGPLLTYDMFIILEQLQ